MKYLIYTALCFIAALVFLPRTGTTEIRNLPLLIFLLSLVLIAILVRFFRYVVLMTKTKRLLKGQGAISLTRCCFFPWGAFFRGRYSITFLHEGTKVQMILLSRKRRYPRYHFTRVDLLEFYRANRLVVKGGRGRWAAVSDAVEVHCVGKQRLAWDPSAAVRVVLFDKLPNAVTDCVRREELAAGDRICATETYLMDFPLLCEKICVGGME